MNRLQKKCLVASTGTHLSLVLIVFIGAAFIAPDHRLDSPPPLTVVPFNVFDGPSHGGGNPNLEPSNDRQKGDTLVPTPTPTRAANPAPAPAPPPTPVVTPPRPVVTPPKPKPEIQHHEEAKPRPTKDSASAFTKPSKDKPLPKETETKSEFVEKVVKPSKDPTPSADFVPKQRNTDELRKLKEAERAAAEAAEAAAVAKQVSKAIGGLGRAGFADGTKIDVPGPGGVAFANYAEFVRAVYDNAWRIPQMLSEEDAVTVVKVVIARTGRVITAEISTRSGNTTADKSVQRALDAVRFIRAFPEGTHDEQRTFIIDFSLKAKRLTG